MTEPWIVVTSAQDSTVSSPLHGSSSSAARRQAFVAEASAIGRRWPVWPPLLSVLFVSLLIRMFGVDQQVSALCYDSIRGQWPFERADPWLWFYRHGTIPPVAIGICGAVLALFGGYLRPLLDQRNTETWRRAGLFLALMLLIGPGLLVNVSLKTLWGRPRPVQCAEFGGTMTFLPIGDLASSRLANSSFPSGHAAVAFFMIGPAFVISPGRRRLQRVCLFAGLAYGLAMGFTRVLQGGHFVSDVLWAGAIVYFVGVVLAHMLIPND
jgi:lipid A 4'-phosphatase